MKIEREWRQTMGEDLKKEKETLSSLKTETQQIITLKKVNSIAKFLKITFKSDVLKEYLCIGESLQFLFREDTWRKKLQEGTQQNMSS